MVVFKGKLNIIILIRTKVTYRFILKNYVLNKASFVVFTIRPLRVLRDAKRKPSSGVVHITNRTIVLHCIILRVFVGGVVIVFGELDPSMQARLLFPLPLKIQVVLLFQLVQTLAVLAGGQQSDTRV